MQQVMLFGEGRNGEVYEVEDGCREIHYTPDKTFPLGKVVFKITEYTSEDGEMYLIGYHGREPLTPDVEDAIQRYKPIPI
ncbi:TPA: hypothetical protein MYV51_003143 [Citrobacter amalonaticus]|uniref:hypothetical protein n=1 Tax=Citrobacter amalonaticus TaxID=35703 RepID=UPI00388F9A77|nr:hypothetical protein [Citrobacter amalonaticus]